MGSRSLVFLIVTAGWALPGLAGPTTAAVSFTDKQGIEPTCRTAVTDVLEANGLTVMDEKADPVLADLVVPVEFEESGSRCSLEPFVNPTNQVLTRASGRGEGRAEACRQAAVALRERLHAPLQKLLQQGLPQVVLLRWPGKLEPRPDILVAGFLRKLAVKVQPQGSMQGQAKFHLVTKQSPSEVGENVSSFLKQHYRVEKLQMGDLPRSPRTHWYLLKRR